MIPDPPEGTRLVLFTREGMRTLAGEGRVEWGEPAPEGWYVPTFYVDPRIDNLKREASVLEQELAELKALFDITWRSDQRAIARWQDAHPGSDLVWPDRTDLVVWLMEQWVTK